MEALGTHRDSDGVQAAPYRVIGPHGPGTSHSSHQPPIGTSERVSPSPHRVEPAALEVTVDGLLRLDGHVGSLNEIVCHSGLSERG